MSPTQGQKTSFFFREDGPERLWTGEHEAQQRSLSGQSTLQAGDNHLKQKHLKTPAWRLPSETAEPGHPTDKLCPHSKELPISFLVPHLIKTNSKGWPNRRRKRRPDQPNGISRKQRPRTEETMKIKRIWPSSEKWPSILKTSTRKC